MWKELEATLCDLRFIEAKCAAGMVYQLLADYASAVQAFEGSEVALKRGNAFYHFVQSESHNLKAEPALTCQHAYNSADVGAVAETAELRLRDEEDRFGCWFRRMNRPRFEQTRRVIQTFRRPFDGISGDMFEIRLDPQSSRLLCAGAGIAGIEMCDTKSGEFLGSLGSDEYLAIATRGGKVLGHSGGPLFSRERQEKYHLWDLETRTLLRSFPVGEQTLSLFRAGGNVSFLKPRSFLVGNLYLAGDGTVIEVWRAFDPEARERSCEPACVARLTLLGFYAGGVDQHGSRRLPSLR